MTTTKKQAVEKPPWGNKRKRGQTRGTFILEHSILNTFSISKLPSRRFSAILSSSSTLCSPRCVCSSNSVLSPSIKSTNSWLWSLRCSSSHISFLTCNMGLLKIAIAYLYQQSTLYLSPIHSFHPPMIFPSGSPEQAVWRLFMRKLKGQFLSNVKHWGGICHFADGALFQRHSAMGTSTFNTTQSFYSSC